MSGNDNALDILTTPFSKWKNPTQEKISFTILKEGRLGRIEVKPGESVDLPADLDNAIRKVKDGVVVSGLAPMLVKAGEENVPLHFAIADSIEAGDLERIERGVTRIGGRDAAALVRAAKIRSEQAKTPKASPAIEAAKAEAEKAEAELAELKALQERKEKAAAEAAALREKLDSAGLGTPVDSNSKTAKRASGGG